MGQHHYPKGPRVRVNVTKEQLARAVATDSSKCWIAEAIKEAYPVATAVSVDVATTRFSNLEKGHRYVFITPYAAQLALLKFDEGTPPAPFAFILKNAHVTKAGGGTPRKKEKDAARTRDRKNAKLLSRTALTGGNRATGNLPRRVGGKRPPQLRMKRMFGIRAFAGASLKRLEADADLIARAERQST